MTMIHSFMYHVQLYVLWNTVFILFHTTWKNLYDPQCMYDYLLVGLQQNKSLNQLINGLYYITKLYCLHFQY